MSFCANRVVSTNRARFDIGAHESRFDIVVSRENVQKLRLFFVKHILIGASIPDTEHLNRFPAASYPSVTWTQAHSSNMVSSMFGGVMGV